MALVSSDGGGWMVYGRGFGLLAWSLPTLGGRRHGLFLGLGLGLVVFIYLFGECECECKAL